MERGASKLQELIGGGWGDPGGAGEAMQVGPQSCGGPGWRREPELSAVGGRAAVWSGRSGSRKEGLFGNKTEAAGYAWSQGEPTSCCRKAVFSSEFPPHFHIQPPSSVCFTQL